MRNDKVTEKTGCSSDKPIPRKEQLSYPKRWLSPSSLVHLKSWLREPLVHFLLIGLSLFIIYAVLSPPQGKRENPNRVELTVDDLRQLQIAFTAQWQRPPTPEELAGLINSRVREEILYREALALGLDKEDAIVKRRMAQKMQFLAEDVAAAREPTTPDLKAWYEKNTDKFALPSRFSFRHLYFSPDQRGQRTHDDAAKALVKLAGQPEDSKLAASLADQFMFQNYYGDRTTEQLAKEFGPGFAVAVSKLKPGSWQGPIESGYGWHLVFVDSVIPGRFPAFDEIEPDVKTAWLGEQKQKAWQKAYKTMRDKYTVLLPAPPTKQSGRAPAPPEPREIATSSGEGPL